MPGSGGELVVDGVAVAPCEAAGFDSLPHHIAVHIILELGFLVLLQAVGRVGDVEGGQVRGDAVAFGVETESILIPNESLIS
jgi:hypothetical protein